MGMVVNGTFTGTGTSTSIAGAKQGHIAISVEDFGSATVVLEWSFDGTNWDELESYTSDTNKVAISPSDQVQYRLRCSSYTSGTIRYGLAG